MMTRLNIVPEHQIQTIGIQTLKEQLGVTGTLEFLKHFDNGGQGDYTKEKYEKEDIELTDEEILDMLERN